jgi:hypothetical protein
MITNVFLDQKRINVCEHMVKTAPHDGFTKMPPEWVQDRKGGGMEMKGTFNGNYLRLIPPELCLEDRMN